MTRDEWQDKLLKAASEVVAAFDAGVFVRDTSHDHEPGWAIKAFPHLAALGRLVEAVNELKAEVSQ